MLKKSFLLVYAVLSLLVCQLYANSPGGQPTIRWYTNYAEAVQQSRSESKPMFLFFTGSDWCSWCQKLDEEALNTADFAATAGNRFIFVKLDLPLYVNQDPQLKAQNKQLQQQFDIRSFPTVLLLDPQQNRIGITGYRPGGGRAFADYVLKLVNDYGAYKQTMSALDNANCSGSELKNMYEKSLALNLENDTYKIVKKGIASDESVFFLTERYRILANDGLVQSKEATTLRQQLLAADPLNEKQVQYQVALIEFQAFTDKMETENYSPELATAPLVNYLDKFGAQDKDNLWRMKILISQVYLDKNQMTSALKFAQESYDSAPSSVQPEIGRAIQIIRSQMHSAR